MTDIKIDSETGDLAVEGNELVLIAGADEVEQRLRRRLAMFRGEWFLNTTRGVPYRTEIFVKGVSPERIAASIKREILTTSGVLALLEYDQAFDSAQRKLTVTFKVQATDGEIIELSEVLAA